jgi:hypothetical protein
MFHDEELLAPRPTLKLDGHPLSVVRDCLFNISQLPSISIRKLRTRHAVVAETHLSRPSEYKPEILPFETD